MGIEEIALELTKAAIEQGLIKRLPVNEAENNVAIAESISKAYDIIYKSVNDTLAGE